MTQSLAPSDELALAQAEASAAQAEADAADARAEAARAHARLTRLRTAQHVEAPAQQSSDTSDRTREDAETDATEAQPAGDSPGTDAADAGKRPSRDRRTTARDTVRRFRALRVPIRRLSRRTVLIAVMGLITAAALVATAVMGWQHREAQAETSRAAEYVAAAERGVTAITSLDFRHAKRDVDRIVAQSSGPFYDDFSKRAPDFTKVIEQSQVTTTGKVTSTALESTTDDDAIVLVAATSEVTNAAGARQEPRVWRLRVTVTDVDGTTKISNVEFVP
ncbi:hypothetical protein [Gordonia sp. NPDC127522]|uniref:hypothetical protein n=1 Tax=Gordonia sp. NPDC127522 TaxID=3345390 RepID=UPI00362AFA91